MSAKRFLVDALGSALGVGLATPDDVLRHITADVLAEHLPRPLWSRLLAASLGAARLDSALVVETIGVANLCEHIPSDIVFGCITEIAHRALGKHLVAPPPAPMLARGARATIPPPPSSAGGSSDVFTSAAVAAPEAPLAIGPDAPGEDDISNLAASLGDAIDEALLPDDRHPDGRNRTPTRPPTRAGLSTRPGASSRKPQTSAPAPAAAQPSGRVPQPIAPPVRRGQTELETFEDSDFGSEGETRVGLSTSTVENEVAVDEEQLVDWQPS